MTEIPDTRFAETPVGRIAYQVVGSGSVPILVAHPPYFPIDLMWDEPRLVEFLDRMSTFSTHVWFDPRGRGASDPLPHDEGRFQETMLEDLVGVLDALGLEKVAVLALSGGVVPFFAASHPERVSALVLFNGAARFLRSDDFPAGLSPETVDQTLAGIRDTWGTIDGGRGPAGDLARDPDFLRWFAKGRRLTCSGDEAVWRLRAMLAFDQTSILGSIKVPTLVISRPNSPPLPAGAGRDLCSRIDGAKYVELAGDDFLFFAADSDALLDAVEEFLTGDLPRHDSDRVLATVVFTDLVGSTAHAARLGDREWTSILGAHDSIVASEIRRHRGRRIKSTGDGVLATFDGPGRAVRCAESIIEAVHDLGVEARAGVHTGEIELRGDDVGGIGVHIAARISGVAGPGVVMVSRTVTELVAGSGINFEDRGAYALKGVPGEWPLYSVKPASS